MKSIYYLMLLFIGIFLLAGTTSAQSEDNFLEDLTLIQTINLEDLNIEELDRRSMALSPDGTMLVYDKTREAICTYVIDLSREHCTFYPQDSRVDAFILQWSQDSRFVAIESSALRTFREPDLWVYDVENQQLLNRTNDGSVESFLRPEEDKPEPLFDITYSWDRHTNDLYFIRTYPRRDDIQEIYRIPGGGSGGFMGIGDSGGDDEIMEDSEPELVVDLSGKVEWLSIYNLETVAFDGAISVSPDGDEAAILVISPARDAPNNGIWILDLITGEFSQAVQQSAFSGVGLPEMNRETPVLINGMAWLEDGLLVHTSNRLDPINILTNLYFVDLDTSEITPLLDFSALTGFEDYISREETNGLVEPVFAGLLPDESAVIYSSSQPMQNNQGVLWALPLPPSPDDVPIALTLPDEEFTPSTFRITIGMNEDYVRVLMGNRIFTFEYQE